MYQAPPVRRVHIPKGSATETRPLGIPTVGYCVRQMVVKMDPGAIGGAAFSSRLLRGIVPEICGAGRGLLRVSVLVFRLGD